MSRTLSLALLASLSAAGCSPEAPAELPSAVLALDKGWIPALIRDPSAFAKLVDGPERGGWISLHGGDYEAAATALSGVPAARAWMAEATLESDLARLADLSFLETFAAWKARSGVPSGSAIPVIAALVALDAGDAEAARRWLSEGGPYTDPDVAALATQLAGGLEGVNGTGRLGAIVKAELDARASGDRALTPPADLDGAPFVSEPTATGSLNFQRPMTHRTAAIIATKAANTALGATVIGAALAPPTGEAPLSALLFSPWWSTDDARADLALDPSLHTPGSAGPGWLGLGPVGAGAAQDSADIARARVTELDGRLNAWREAREADLGPEALELVQNLQLVPVYRAQLLLGWARAALLANRPLEAEVYARMGQDLERLREIGPTNPPGLYVVLAEALVRNHRAREALDALQPLAARDPALLVDITETLGDLAVLESMGRLGDSKEN